MHKHSNSNIGIIASYSNFRLIDYLRTQEKINIIAELIRRYRRIDGEIFDKEQIECNC